MRLITPPIVIRSVKTLRTMAWYAASNYPATAVLTSEGWREAWRPSPSCNQEPFLATDKDGRLPRGLPYDALLLYVWRWCAAGVVLGMSTEELHGMLISSFLPSVFHEHYCFLLLSISYCVILFAVLSVLLFWFSCQYQPNDWLERLWWRLFKSRRLSFVLFCLFMLLCVCPWPCTIYFIRPWHDIVLLGWKCRWTPTNFIPSTLHKSLCWWCHTL